MKKMIIFVILAVVGLAVLNQIGLGPKSPGKKVDEWRPYYIEVSKVRSSNPILHLMPNEAQYAVRSVSYKAVPRAGVRDSYWELPSHTTVTICSDGSTCSVVTVTGSPEEIPRKLELIKSNWNWIKLMNRCDRPNSVDYNLGCPKQGWEAIGKQFDIDLVSRAKEVLANANDGRGSSCNEYLYCPEWEKYLGPLPS